VEIYYLFLAKMVIYIKIVKWKLILYQKGIWKNTFYSATLKDHKKDPVVLKKRYENKRKFKELNPSLNSKDLIIYKSGSKEKTCSCNGKCATKKCDCRGGEERSYCSNFCQCDKSKCKNKE
jgi:hypothetical protein